MKTIVMNILGNEKFLFLAIGGFNTIFGYLNFAFIQFLWGKEITYIGSLLCSHGLTSTLAFFLYRRLVFKVSGKIVTDFIKFQSVYIFPLVTNIILLPMAVQFGKLNPYLAQAVVTICLTVVSYIGHKYFSFRRPNSQSHKTYTFSETNN